MILLVDMGNTRVKWRVQTAGEVLAAGVGLLEDPELFAPLNRIAGRIERVAVSTVASEQQREQLRQCLGRLVAAPTTFYWSEAERSGLRNAYRDVQKMGADRWHAMCGAWARSRASGLVVDAGSAITVDFIATEGQHLGGYILAGRSMMLRALAQDAARINYDSAADGRGQPGRNTGECVFHGLQWFWQALADRLNREASERRLAAIYVTGGDADELLRQGLQGIHCPELVLDGLAAIVAGEDGS